MNNIHSFKKATREGRIPTACGSARYVGGLLEISVAASGQARADLRERRPGDSDKRRKKSIRKYAVRKNVSDFARTASPHVTLRYVPREPVLFDESVRENICMGAPMTRNHFQLFWSRQIFYGT